jgi:hypothetical protein
VREARDTEPAPDAIADADVSLDTSDVDGDAPVRDARRGDAAPETGVADATADVSDGGTDVATSDVSDTRGDIAPQDGMGGGSFSKKTFPTRTNIGIADIAIDTNGNVYVTGGVERGWPNSTSNNVDVLVAKYDSSGMLQWSHVMGGPGGDIGRGLALDESSDDVYVVGMGRKGWFNNGHSGKRDGFVAKFPQSGPKPDWKKLFSSSSVFPKLELLEDVTVNNKGDVYTTGYKTTPQTQGGNGRKDIVLVKYAPDGKRLKEMTLFDRKPNRSDRGYEIEAEGNDIYVVGFVRPNSNNSDRDGFVARYTDTGHDLKKQWSEVVGTTKQDGLYGLTLGPSGTVYAAGAMKGQLGSRSTSRDGAVLEFDPQNGNRTDAYYFGGLGTRLLALTVDANGNTLHAVGGEKINRSQKDPEGLWIAFDPQAPTSSLSGQQFDTPNDDRLQSVALDGAKTYVSGWENGSTSTPKSADGFVSRIQ